MTVRIGVVMDPIASINPKKDSTLAMLLAAQRRQWELWYMLRTDLHLQDGICHGDMRQLTVKDDLESWFSFGKQQQAPLQSLDIVLMRVDPPYNMEYIYTTHLLQKAFEQGVMVVNRPDSLRLMNEKLQVSQFSEFTPPTLVSANMVHIRHFLEEQHNIVVKPLDGMGGRSIFRVNIDDPNASVILETITDNSQTTVMAQRFIPEITEGDKRILLIDGEPIPYALARIPGKGEFRGNLAVGGHGVGKPLSDRDKAICAAVGPTLKDHGIVFAGLDVIGDYLTEINITSPTCIRELDAIYDLDIAGTLMDAITSKRKTS